MPVSFDLDRFSHAVAIAIEIAGVAVIVVGVIAATVIFALHGWRRRGFAEAYQQYRTHLGQAILLGLEFLVAADIVNTVVVEPSFESLGVLAVVVAIRTFLSFSLEVEIHGRWPWQAPHRAHVARESGT